MARYLNEIRLDICLARPGSESVLVRAGLYEMLGQGLSSERSVIGCVVCLVAR
jgi:hypothetical protein